MDDDYDYQAPDEEMNISYNEEYYEPQNDETGLNYEDMFIEAEGSKDINKYKEIIELEKDNSSTCQWAFKCYEKMCLIHIQNKDLELFQECFQKLFELYPKVDDYDKQDTIRNCSYQLYDANDNEFSLSVLRFMLDLLKDLGVDREAMNTGVQFAKTLLTLNKTEELGDV